ncbi:uncharacterized protein [Salminus brasiliensis]|uniref:uncharacterized protein n=1 Tax=Salminus brasiliensis TaxID=930266 RepID=UPI003B836BB0
MIWIRAFVIGSLLSVLEAHKQCSQMIRWGNLYKALTGMSTDISGVCAPHYKIDSLCDPAQMLNQVELNAVLLVDIMKKAESIYRKNPNPENLIQGLKHTQHTLTPCAHHAHDHEPVTTCFNKLETFIQDNMAHAGCAWEIVNARVRELLQRLEKRTLRRRR